MSPPGWLKDGFSGEQIRQENIQNRTIAATDDRFHRL
jgi:hypothetical protein